MLFAEIFGRSFHDLPEGWQRFHHVSSTHQFEGFAEVKRGRGLFISLLAKLLDLPVADRVPVRLTLIKDGEGERWLRLFGSSELNTKLLPAKGEAPFALYEIYGPFRFCVELHVKDETVEWTLINWWFLGVPLPKMVLPISRTVETVDAQGRYCFDIDLEIPLFGRLIAYRGWLDPV